MKIGLIQTQSIGDIVIALPIAAWYADRGHTVFWPVNELYLEFLVSAAPYVIFIPISATPGQDLDNYFYHDPMAILLQHGCDRVFTLDRNYSRKDVRNLALAVPLKFDEYKYAVAGVPFSEKWKLRLERDKGRELALHAMLNLTREYICVHSTGSDYFVPVTLPEAWSTRYQIVEITSLTDNPFDWLFTIENAAKRVLLDSSFANLTDQMNIRDNYLILRSSIGLTPVLKNNWKFLHSSVRTSDDVLVPLNSDGWDP